MSKKRRNSADSSTNAGKSPVEIIVAKYGLVGTIITALLTLLGVVITVYVAYLTSRPQIIAPLDSTQTAEARQTDLIPSPTLLTAVWSETPLAPTDISIVTLTV